MHTAEIFTYRFEGERVVERVERMVYFIDLQTCAPHGTLTARVKEIHYVDGTIRRPNSRPCFYQIFNGPPNPKSLQRRELGLLKL